MSDISGTTPEEPIEPEEGGVPEEPLIPPADAVIPPPPPEIPIPDGLLAPPSSAAIPPADAVIPPPPAETRRRSDRPRPTPAILDGEPPAAVADDWAQPSVAPEVPTSGGYGGLTVAIFVFLFVLLIAAIGLVVFLLNTVSFPWASSDSAVSLAVALRL
ncbi:hypothetical protein [Microbacterium sp. J1-1]|uniref:hypothetical protein n=1 Tax=Microbacterium sp. J1-1 TaxID=2992441 RepID=UPI0021144092|nr:hypothetical protein [Microbacterium sp. J1-1]UUE20439.1 hypothetical protein LRQ07_16840 [Microbacterium sp. J1-1]